MAHQGQQNSKETVDREKQHEEVWESPARTPAVSDGFQYGRG
jgi:hypothetical protein